MVYGKSGKEYRITYAGAMNVYMRPSKSEYERTLCVVAKGPHIPIPDQMLMQKLMIEMNEDEFLRLANYRDEQPVRIVINSEEVGQMTPDGEGWAPADTTNVRDGWSSF